jgi:murein DD-endopeptidase MepM/ murein hydrolase activator NlpD
MDQKSASTDASEPGKQSNSGSHPASPPPSLALRWEDWWKKMQTRGWADNVLRAGTLLVSLALVLLVLWVMQSFYLKGSQVDVSRVVQGTPAGLSDQRMILPAYAGVSDYTGIARGNDMHTYVPNKSRFEIQTYTVVKGDSLFNIAAKYGLNPTTILWGNSNTLMDNPDNIQPGDVLKILPLDGVLYDWHDGDGLNRVSTTFGVTPDVIINWPGNGLSAETIGDFAKPNIPVGRELFVPGGRREFSSWQAPTIRRDNPASARVLGVGHCDPVTTGPIGNSVFYWPTSERRISGYEYNPPVHWGIDIGGKLGNPIYAMEAGVVVYAGWNDWGYGNLIIIDHGDGWQSLYGHLSSVNVNCGDYITQGGQLIGAMGSTGKSSGPHLHFEMSLNGNRMNPHRYSFS